MNCAWESDQELFQRARELLFTAVVGDVMDDRGLTRQFLPPEIRPIRDDMVIVGRAMTVREADASSPVADIGHNLNIDQPFGIMMEALDDLKPGEVYLCSGSSPEYALWGELMSTRAGALKAAGAIVNGFHRDTAGILRLNFPTFSCGAYAQDQRPRGRVIDFRCPLKIGQVDVNDGDIVFGDRDGVCIVPRSAEREIMNAAFAKASEEKKVKTAIERGMSAREAFDRFGIL